MLVNHELIYYIVIWQLVLTKIELKLTSFVDIASAYKYISAQLKVKAK